MENWSELPDDIVEIFAKLVSNDIEVYARFSVVCKSWRSCLINCLKEKPIACSPWLMLAKKENDNKLSEESEEGTRSFYIPSSKKVISLKLPTQGRRCFGSSHGWLLTMGLDLNINLLNPLSQSQICLPPQPTFQHQYCVYLRPRFQCLNCIKKFAVSSNPSLWSAASNSDQANSVMVIYAVSRSLTIARPGDKVWTSLEGPHADGGQDVIFFNGHFYVVTYIGELVLCDTSSNPPSARLIASPPDFGKSDVFYLVALSGDLFLLGRALETVADDADDADDANDADDADSENNSCDYDGPCCDDVNHYPEDTYYGFYSRTQHFYVFKFDFNNMEWTTVEGLGNHAIFVGNNTSFSISTSEYPDFRGNCIYFTDDNTDHYAGDFCDMGVYDISKKCVEPLYVSESQLSMYSRPLFFRPTPV